MEKATAAPQYPQSTGTPQPPMYHDPNQAQVYHDPNQIYQQQQGVQYPNAVYPQGGPQPVYSDPNQAAYLQATTPGTTDKGHPAPQQEQQFQNVVPLNGLSRSPAPVDCPACKQRGLTTVSFESGNTTHAWAAVAFCLACLCCIPYLINSTKDVVHKCSKCNALLATWHRSGATDVHMHT